MLAAKELAEEAREFGVNALETYTEIPPPTLLSKITARNTPVMFKGAAKTLPAFSLWTDDYIISKISSCTVSKTANGRADSILDSKFTLPFNFEMDMKDFIQTRKQSQYPLYIQSQNSNLTTEFSALLPDIPLPDWTRWVFDKEPDAVNFWFGDSSSTTSTHKDNYDNLVAVIRGQKIFSLFPPTDYACFDHFELPVYQYNKDMNLEPCGYSTIWCSDTPTGVDALNVVVEAGDILFLPGLWFHKVVIIIIKVSQKEDTVMVNWWFDLDYSDSRVSYFEFLKKVVGFAQV